MTLTDAVLPSVLEAAMNTRMENQLRGAAAPGPQRVAAITSQALEGHRVTAYLGIARGIVVRSTGIAGGIVGGLKSMLGGNVGTYERVCEEARTQAFDRMVDHAIGLGANAVIAVSYDAESFAQGVTEVLCYGTAVRVEPLDAP